jgi:DNA-binding transcriptional ArsR family regulator
MGSEDRLLRLAKALSHPLRQRILEMMTDREASPNEISQLTGSRLGTVSYHVQVLRELDCIELTRTAERRGATEHYYRARFALDLVDAELARFSPEARRALANGTIEHIWSDLAEAAAQGGFDRPDLHVSRIPLRVDRQGWDEVSGLLVELIDATKRIERESAERGGGLEDCELALLHFATAASVTPRDPPPESR